MFLLVIPLDFTVYDLHTEFLTQTVSSWFQSLLRARHPSSHDIEVCVFFWVIYPKYHKHWLYILVVTIICCCLPYLVHLKEKNWKCLTFGFINFLVQTVQCTHSSILYLFCPWKFEKKPFILVFIVCLGYIILPKFSRSNQVRTESR